MRSLQETPATDAGEHSPAHGPRGDILNKVGFREKTMGERRSDFPSSDMQT